jgi:hypothetical protein
MLYSSNVLRPAPPVTLFTFHLPTFIFSIMQKDALFLPNKSCSTIYLTYRIEIWHCQHGARTFCTTVL